MHKELRTPRNVYPLLNLKPNKSFPFIRTGTFRLSLDIQPHSHRYIGKKKKS